MEPIAKDREKRFFSDLLELCKKHGVSIGCTDSYEFLNLGEYCTAFEEEFKKIYLDDLVYSQIKCHAPEI